ncbi:MAG: hypothetical protein JWQ73_13 [Variovorax sp.]|jgi:hypothetical protein|nr:hypothetical protein [Variovorax sp.]
MTDLHRCATNMARGRRHGPLARSGVPVCGAEPAVHQSIRVERDSGLVTESRGSLWNLQPTADTSARRDPAAAARKSLEIEFLLV